MKNNTVHNNDWFLGSGPEREPSGGQRLRKGRVCTFPGMDRGCGVHCVSGMLWITRENDHGDHILTEASSWTMDGPGMVVVEALVDSVFRILRPVAARLGLELGKEAS